MLRELTDRAKKGEAVYLDAFAAACAAAESKTSLGMGLELLDGTLRVFELELPAEEADADARAMIADFLHARIYNMLSALGGRRLFLRYDAGLLWLDEMLRGLDEVFELKKSRRERLSYGKCINVVERMLGKLSEGEGGQAPGFAFLLNAPWPNTAETRAPGAKAFKPRLEAALRRSAEEALCGLDVGGTDIKLALSDRGTLICLKEFDWFPAEYGEARLLIDPIVALLRLARIQLNLHRSPVRLDAEQRALLDAAMDKHSAIEAIYRCVEALEKLWPQGLINFDGVGLCFPDVVVRNKVVGGEVYKTRGMRDNAALDYESEYAKLSDLDLYLKPYCKQPSRVRLCNDGPMAAFTAAMENIEGGQGISLEQGVFAHTLGTELGTGWVDEQGAIPEIPLEVYNFVVDLGSYPARAYPADDLRSVNNFNTGIPGTLQKYASQSGVFRLLLEDLPAKRPALWAELLRRDFVRVERRADGSEFWRCPTEPVDQRKPFLEFVMQAAAREADPLLDEIFVEIGRSLAVTSEECDLILRAQSRERILFGRLVKQPHCFALIKRGFAERFPQLRLLAADGELANTPMMKALGERTDFTVAQFAQAVGALYFAAFED